MAISIPREVVCFFMNQDLGFPTAEVRETGTLYISADRSVSVFHNHNKGCHINVTKENSKTDAAIGALFAYYTKGGERQAFTLGRMQEHKT